MTARVGRARAVLAAATGGPSASDLAFPRTPLDAWIAGLAGQPAGVPLHADALAGLQLRGLRRTIDLANRSRHYAGRLPDPTSMGLADLCRLPFTTAEDLRSDPFALACVGQGSISRIVTLATSGTTGAPKRVAFSEADQALTRDFFGVGMSVFTGPGDVALVLLPCATPGGVGDILALALEDIGARPVRYGLVRDPDDALRVAVDEGATVAIGIPTQVLAMVRAVSPEAPRPPLHSVLLSTDHVPVAAASAIEAAWGCRVYNHFGMTETGLGGGVDCRARRGYHLREADLLAEIVDPETLDTVPDGVEGELVITTLTREAMPLLRYRTGDLARFLPEPCPCGTILRTLAHVRTRVSGGVDVGGPLPLTQADLDEALFALPATVDFDASVRMTGGRRSLSVTVRVRRGDDRSRVAGAVRAAIGAVPAVREAAAAGALALTVDVASLVLPLPVPRKRSIAKGDAVPSPDPRSPEAWSPAP